MNTFIIYKAIKDRLAVVAQGFYYLSQYAKGKDNTSYKVPAIYIEMPKFMKIDFFPGKIEAARDAQVKIHLITNAPYKNHDTTVQDTAIAEHQNKLNDLDALLTGWHVTGNDGKILTQQFIPIAASIGNYINTNLFSIITYKTEFYNRHLQL